MGGRFFARRNSARLQHVDSHFSHGRVVEERDLEAADAALEQRSRRALRVEIQLGFQGFEVARVEQGLVEDVNDALKG